MSFASLLIHTCDIGILTQGVADGYGTPAKTWPTVGHTSVACRLMSTSGREIKVGAEVMISDWKLFVDTTEVIDEQDRVSNIKLASTGVVVDSSTFEVLMVQPRSDGVTGHHKECFLQKVV